MTFLPRPQDTLLSVGDRKIAVIERGTGGVPLIFLHGGGPGGNSWLDFSPVLEYFSDRRCIFLDLPQYGGSSKEPFSGPNWSFHARHIVGAMDVLGIEKADMAGGSVGATAALAAAINYPDRVRRLALSGCQPTVRHPAILEHQYTIGSKVVPPLYEGGPSLEKTRKLILDVEWYDPATLPEERVQARYEGLLEQVPLQNTPGARGEREDLTDRLPQVKAPCIFIWGAQDPFLTAEYALALSRTVQYGDLHVMNRASHHLFAERPKDYALALHSFLDADLYGVD